MARGGLTSRCGDIGSRCKKAGMRGPRVLQNAQLMGKEQRETKLLVSCGDDCLFRWPQGLGLPLSSKPWVLPHNMGLGKGHLSAAEL